MREPILPLTAKGTAPNWAITSYLLILHVGAVIALFHVNLKAVLAAFVLNWIALCFGVGMGYHRLLTHRCYRVPRWIEYSLAVCGTLSLQGGPIFWVATHRMHHQLADLPGDPHSPHDGGFWSHAGWLLTGDSKQYQTLVMGRYAPDLTRDPLYRWMNLYHWVPLAVIGLALFAWGGWPVVLWAIFFRVTVGMHFTWFVNSATHMWGSRRFETRDDSRNSWWVALLTFGEGWHNNHHAHPTSARHGLAWYEVDITWMHIRLLQKLGIATNVQAARLPDHDVRPAVLEEAAARR